MRIAPKTPPVEPEPVPARPAPTRVVVTGDGVGWIQDHPLPASHAVVTSMPDVSELPTLGFDGWREWFVSTAALLCGAVAEDSVAVFYQTDVRREGRWVDKAHLVALGAAQAGAGCVFHRIVCRVPAGTETSGRAGYGHLLAFSRGSRVHATGALSDVLPAAGRATWSRGMGVAACEAACRFVLESTACRVIVDPFCGQGAVLAVANGLGLDAIGVEISESRAQRARTLDLRGEALR